MSPRYDDDWVATMLDAESRQGELTPEELLRSAGLGEGQTVIDVGCGPGFLTLPAAAVVGRLGRVYAVDVEQQMLDLVQRRAASEGVDNIETVLSPGDLVPLEDQTGDYAICGLVLHYPDELARRVDMARDIARLLRPGGRALLIEWAPQPDDDPDQRMGPEEMATVLREAGLEGGGPKPLGEKQYTMVARRPISEGGPR